MNKFFTTAAVLAALTMPAFAEGEQPSDKTGEAKGNVKASTDLKQGESKSMGTAKTTGSSTMSAPASKTPAMNEKAGDTAAGEAKK